MQRRTFLRSGAAAGAAILASPAAAAVPGAPGFDPTARTSYKHSVCQWPFGKIPLEQLAAAAKRFGMHSVELLGPEAWPTVKRYGLTCAMGYTPAAKEYNRIAEGWNRIAHHDYLVPEYERGIPLAAAAGVPSVICFSGNRAGLSDAEGMENCAKGLKRIMPIAERLGVNVVMELLNSKINHKDYQADHTAWGAELVQKVGSPRFKLLYDIYHMQIMEGDVINTIRTYRDAIGHYHTAGVPGRHEIDHTQELQYPAIMRAINDTGFTGYVAQEFIPVREPLASLKQAVKICSV